MKHTQVLLTYLSDWENKFPNRNKMAEVCGIQQQTLYTHFSPAELDGILSDGLELRKKHSAKQRAEVYDDLRQASKDGNVSAQKEFLDRTEGKVLDRKEVDLKGNITFEIIDSVTDE